MATDRLPTPLSERLSAASSALYARQGREFDVAIGGIPFMLATTPELPQSVETIPIRKEQFDTEVDPGEQSLSGWWRRSQASFHGGAGNLYAEGLESNEPGVGFYDSSGVDVFSQRGQITMIRRMVHDWLSSFSGERFSRMRTYGADLVRQNLCTNPSFETDTSGWVADDGGTPADLPTLSRVNADAEGVSPAPSGSMVGKVTWGSYVGSAASIILPPATVVNGAEYRIRVSVYVPSGNPDVQLGADTTVLPDTWVDLHILNYTATSTTTGTDLRITPTTPPTAGDVFYLDACIIEIRPHDEFGILGFSYFDGNHPDAAWDGTTNLSTSTYTLSNVGVAKSAVGEGNLYQADAYDESLLALHEPATTIVDGLISKTTFYDVASDGTLYQGDVASPTTATTWPCGPTPDRLGWGKHRLWIIGGRKLWQPDLSLAAGTNQDPIFTHPNQGWTYTCMTEGPSAMYFGGHDGFNSSIQAVTLETDGGLPVLSGASVTASLPNGELVTELATVAGQYIGIGTTRGFRVGVVQPGNANIVYGPLLIEPEGVVRCTAIAAQGRFFLVAFETGDGSPVAYRVDTSTELADGVFPYAKDVELTHQTSINSIAVAEDNIICTSTDGQSWYQSATDLVETAWIDMGRVRFRTTENKSFKYLDVEIEPLAGAIQCEAILEGGSTSTLGNITSEGELFNEPLEIALYPMRHLALKFYFTRSSTDTSEGPTLLSYLLRALPAAKAQRKITLPLLCFDHEQSRSGQRYGGQGYARDRLTAMQLLEDSAESLIYQDFSTDDSTGEVVTIESMRFVRTSPPNPNRQEGAGGILLVELRTVQA